MDLGDLSFHEGDWKEAARWLHEGLDLAISADDLYAIRVIQLRLARLDILEGRPEAAVERLTPLLDRPGFEETLVTPMLAFLAWARLEMGDLDRAEEMIESALRRARREHRQEHLVETLGVRARIFMVQRCWERAEEALYERLALASGMPYPYARATSLYELGLLSCAIGDPDAARKQLLQAIDIFRQLGAKKDIERTEETLARLDRA
jgi:tetratricopeptide (TPR) repeat protein